MCGIAGFQLTDKDTPKAADLAAELLLGIEERGRHATGAAWWEDDAVWIVKEPIPARVFNEYEHVPASTRSAILHTRYATKGSTKDAENNHPIDVGNIVGVHNGVLWNDDEVRRDFGGWEPTAEVDSEAIFGALAFSGLPAVEVLSALQGSAAVAWFDDEPDMLWLARASSSPLVWARTASGSIIFASTQAAIVKAAGKSKMPVHGIFTAQEGTLVGVRDGRIVHVERFQTERIGTMTQVERMALNLG